MFSKKFPFIKQHDSMQCGSTCLQMILKYYGKNFTSDYLNNLCGVSKDGVSLLSISEVANQLGMHSICGRVTLEKLSKEAPLPCIIHWNQNHFVVLYKVKGNRPGERKYYIADPGNGLFVFDESQLVDSWISTKTKDQDKGIALFLQPTPKLYQQEDSSISEKKSFKFLLGYVKQYKKYFTQIILGLFIGSLLQLIFPFLTQAIVDVGIANQNIGFIYLILLAQLMLVIGRTSIDYIRRWILLHISMRINVSLVSDFFIKLMKLPMAYFDTKLMGDILQRLEDHSRVEQFLTSQFLSILFSLFSFVIFTIVLFTYNLLISIAFLAGSLIYGLWIAVFLKKRKKYDYLYFEQQANNNSKTYQLINSMQEIKLQDCEQRRRWEWEDVQADLFQVKMKILKLQQKQEAGSLLINEIKNIIVTILAATCVINGEMTLGMMLAVQYIIGQLNSPIDQIMKFIYSLQDVKISLERINEVHIMQDERKNVHQIKENIGSKGILLKNISFKYEVHSPNKVLDNVSLTIPQGKVTAIVGTSGSGKTTLLKLLLGYYPVLDGEIIVDSVNLNNIDIKWWRRQCGVVMQDGYIFSETIARNIAVDDNEIDKSRLLYASKIANIEDFIERLPLKYNTIIGADGQGISQGQRQRVLIARAVYKNPAYIFLDEATNSLDANNEKDIVGNLKEYYTGRTVIIVAHRLSTVRDADQIVVIDKGHIIETGDHDSLIQSKGAYYNLIKNQLELGN